MKEIEIIRKKAGSDVATQVSELLHVMDRLPVNACALAVYPAIFVDKTFKTNKLSHRVFVLVHEYVHLAYQHGQTTHWLVTHPQCQFLKHRERKSIAISAVEDWANSKARQLLGFAPKGMAIPILNGELRGLASMRKWLVKRVLEIASNPDHVKRTVEEIENCYTTNGRRGRKGKAR